MHTHENNLPDAQHIMLSPFLPVFYNEYCCINGKKIEKNKKKKSQGCQATKTYYGVLNRKNKDVSSPQQDFNRLLRFPFIYTNLKYHYVDVNLNGVHQHVISSLSREKDIYIEREREIIRRDTGTVATHTKATMNRLPVDRRR